MNVRAPGRVNLIGEHTDYTGGLVFPMAIDRWTDVEGERSDRLRFRSADESQDVDLPVGVDVDDAADPPWGRYVAAVAAEVGNGLGFDGRVSTTIPIGAGLSSSAALQVALALALGFEGTERELAELVRRSEHRATGVPTGIMDQLSIAAGRDSQAMLIDCNDLSIRYVPIPNELVIVVRFIAHRTLEGSEYANRVAECAAAEKVIGPLRSASLDATTGIEDHVHRRRARHVVTENQRVLDFADALESGDYATAGAIMQDGHRSLRDDFEVSTPTMDAAVAELEADPTVYGARMTGGGFGGCVVALCRPDTNVEGWRVRPVPGARIL